MRKNSDLFLTRNPLLATESRIKKVVQAISLAPRDSTRIGVLDSVARRSGFDSWAEINREQQNVLSKELKFHPESQDDLLRFFAQRAGFSDWSEFVIHAFNCRNYALLSEVLNFDKHRFSLETSGWSAMQKLIGYLDMQQNPYFVVDSTELRLDPETIVPIICERFRISFFEKMINWTDKPKVGSEQKRQQDLLWYDTLLESRGIKPPTEIVPKISNFPLEIGLHLQRVDIPIYAEIFRNSRRIEGSSNKMALMREIDPLFSVLQNPKLLDDEAYFGRVENLGFMKEDLLLLRESIVGSSPERER